MHSPSWEGTRSGPARLRRTGLRFGFGRTKKKDICILQMSFSACQRTSPAAGFFWYNREKGD